MEIQRVNSKETCITYELEMETRTRNKHQLIKDQDHTKNTKTSRITQKHLKDEDEDDASPTAESPGYIADSDSMKDDTDTDYIGYLDEQGTDDE
ncbi:hypothetical protein Tco_1036417, partial [Tanacetum coccineum]